MQYSDNYNIEQLHKSAIIWWKIIVFFFLISFCCVLKRSFIIDDVAIILYLHGHFNEFHNKYQWEDIMILEKLLTAKYSTHIFHNIGYNYKKKKAFVFLESLHFGVCTHIKVEICHQNNIFSSPASLYIKTICP